MLAGMITFQRGNVHVCAGPIMVAFQWQSSMLEKADIVVRANRIMPPDPCRVAILVDGDNAQIGYLERVTAKAGQRGTVAVRRIYGGHEMLDGWAECIRRHGFKPVCAEGKNAADIALTIDAMDILRYKEADGFCIVTSDNDFAELVRRLCKEEVFVEGIGDLEKKLSPLEGACDDFTHFDDLPPPADQDPTVQKIILDWKKAVGEAIRACARDGGWANMADVGNLLKRDPDWNHRAYCHRGLKLLIESCREEFETRGDEVRLHSEDTS